MQIDFPDALSFVFEPARYKCAYGGRGSAKSWSFARALLIQGATKPLRILCCREIQKSISDSVHKLLADQIDAMGLSSLYTVQQSTIRGKNGTEFLFAGLKHNVANLKSIPDLDVVWCEEAQTVSKTSWDVLVPTVRKEGSEIWVSFNPELDTDETYKRFILTPPTGAVVRKVNWNDNPWFPDVLRQEMEDLKARDFDAYLNVWEGHCRQALEGAVYADEIRHATEENRITRVPYDASQPVHTFWDLGWADSTSIWFAQAIGFEFRLIDYIEDSGKKLPHYLKLLKEKPYVYGTDWLPHDAVSEGLMERSVYSGMVDAGRNVQIVPKLSLADGINAARTVFGRCFFDAQRCTEGLQALRHYRYELQSDGISRKRAPVHDWSSHGADAFRYFAVAIQEQPRKKKTSNVSLNWMG